MEAVAANEMEARLLRIPTGAPLMLIESVTYNHEEIPFEYFKARHRGDSTRFLVESYTPVLPTK
jgi:GntR family transcriptional regulator